MSTLVPAGMKSGLMKLYSAIAQLRLYSDVDSFAFARQVLTAHQRCHQQRLILASHTSCAAPISPMSLSLWMKTGLIPYLSRRHCDQATITFFHFPMSIAVA